MTNYFQQSISEQVWYDTYKWETDFSIEDTWKRIAKAVANIEKDKELWEEKFYELLKDFKYVPGGRIISNAGTGLKKTTLINCFVSGFEGKHQDSTESIYKELLRQAKILASEGGYGINFSVLRPRGSYVSGIGNETCGSIVFMDLWDTSSNVLTQGSGKKSSDKGKTKIRKGAQMGMLECWHPSIEEFITSKQQPGKLTKFNLTVLVTNDFMEAVKKHDKWNLEFPDTNFKHYDEEWNGNIKEWKEKEYPINIWKTYEDANELYDLIMKSTYNRNEPGIAFIDRVNELNNLQYCEYINASNPCFTGDTIIAVADGRNGVSIKQLSKEKEFLVYSARNTSKIYGSKGKWKPEIKNAVAFKTGYKEIIEVILSDGSSFKCTPDHMLALNDGTWVKAEESEGSYLSQFFTFSNKNSQKNYRTICSKDNSYNRQYRLIWEFHNGKYDGTKFNIDHIDEIASNDYIKNLQLLSYEQHKKKSDIAKLGKNNPIFRMDIEYRKWINKKRNINANASKYEWSNERRHEAMEKFLRENPKPEIEDKNIYMENMLSVIEIIRLEEYEDVYDLKVEDNHNFYIITNTDDKKYMNCSGILVHNCGEQFLPISGSCNLGSINLTQFIKEDKSGFDLKKLEEYIPTVLRFQDNINDITHFPLKEQKEEAQNKRRVGIGIMGYASSLYILKKEYGSEETLQLTDKLEKFICNKLYQASTVLAKEKGIFPAYMKEEYLKSRFIKQALTKETIAMIEENGMRNSHLTTIAPTGNTGIYANNVSGGLEPVISPFYIRTIMVANIPDELIMPQNIDWQNKKYDCSHDKWIWMKEGDEHTLKKIIEIDGKEVIYKIDRNRGLCKEEEVKDYSLNHIEKFNIEDSYVKTIYNLSPEAHINTMKVFAKYIDAAISKTLNLSKDFSYEDFKNIYMDVYNTGLIKGFTTYREGTMTSVLSVKSETMTAERHAPKRPKVLPCDIHRMTVVGQKWIVFIGLYNNKPYEIFAGKIGEINIPKMITSGKIIKIKSGHYSLEIDDEVVVDNISKTFDNLENDAFSRMISTALRHDTPLRFILEQLSKAKGTIVDFSKAIIISLKKYIKDGIEGGICSNCGEKLIYTEGCLVCKNCGNAKCG
jgi:ribonucleotide reductase alpha subunit